MLAGDSDERFRAAGVAHPGMRLMNAGPLRWRARRELCVRGVVTWLSALAALSFGFACHGEMRRLARRDIALKRKTPEKRKASRALEFELVRRQGFEPWTLGLRVPCSGQLSYRRNARKYCTRLAARVQRPIRVFAGCTNLRHTRRPFRIYERPRAPRYGTRASCQQANRIARTPSRLPAFPSPRPSGRAPPGCRGGTRV